MHNPISIHRLSTCNDMNHIVLKPVPPTSFRVISTAEHIPRIVAKVWCH